MLKKEYVNKELLNIFGVLSYCVDGYNNLGYLDINHDLEDVIKDILNLIGYGNFVNCNDFEKNTKGIDLIDREKNIGIQVTSNQSITKIKDTLNKCDNKVIFVYLSVNKIKHKSYGDLIINFIDLIYLAKVNDKLFDLYNYMKNDTFISEFIRKYFNFSSEIIDNDVSLNDIIKPFKSLNGYIVNRFYSDTDNYKSNDCICNSMIKIMDWIIGDCKFPTNEVIEFYKNYNSNIKIDNTILNSRRKALISYYNDDLKTSKNIYDYNFKKVINSNIPSWYKNDYLIDGRNISNRIDCSYLYSLKNKYQKEIKDSNITITYPLIDRIEKNILNMTLEKNVFCRYKNRKVKVFSTDFDIVFNNIQSLIYISIIYGSITHLNLVRELIKKVLIIFSDSHNDKDIYLLSLKFCILTGDYKHYKNICDKVILDYKEFEDYDYIKEVLGYRKNISNYYKNDFDIFIFDYYGRLLNDKDYLVYEKRTLKLLENHIKINDVTKSLPSNLARISNKDKLFEILYDLAKSPFKRQVEEVIRFIKYEDLNIENRNKIKKIVNEVDINENTLISDLLLDIKRIENTNIYDEYLNKTNDDKLFCKLVLSKEYNPSNLELIVDELIKRHEKCIKDNCITSYAIDFYIPSNYFKKDSKKLRSVIEDKLLPLCLNSLSSEKIEFEEKLKLLRCLIYIHYFDNKYDNYIKNIFNNIKVESEESFIEIYSVDYIKLYILSLKYILKEISLLDLLNEYMIIMNTDYLFVDISIILDYILSKETISKEIENSLLVIIFTMLKSDKVDNRISAINLSKRLYKTSKFKDIYNELYKISIDSSYKEVKALINMIKDIRDRDKYLLQLVDNIKCNKNYNIRYIAKKYL